MVGRARIPAATGLLVVLVVLALTLAPAARAETGLIVDPSWPVAPFGHDFAFGDQGPRAMASDDQRIWVLGNQASAAAQGGVLTALQPGGARDTGFSGDGELPVDIGPSDGGAYGWDVAALPNGDAAVLSSRVGNGESDLAIEVVRPDGSPDPAFAGDGVAVDPRAGRGDADAPGVRPVNPALPRHGRLVRHPGRGPRHVRRGDHLGRRARRELRHRRVPGLRRRRDRPRRLR